MNKAIILTSASAIYVALMTFVIISLRRIIREWMNFMNVYIARE